MGKLWSIDTHANKQTRCIRLGQSDLKCGYFAFRLQQVSTDVTPFHLARMTPSLVREKDSERERDRPPISQSVDLRVQPIIQLLETISAAKMLLSTSLSTCCAAGSPLWSFLQIAEHDNVHFIDQYCIFIMFQGWEELIPFCASSDYISADL